MEELSSRRTHVEIVRALVSLRIPKPSKIWGCAAVRRLDLRSACLHQRLGTKNYNDEMRPWKVDV